MGFWCYAVIQFSKKQFIRDFENEGGNDGKVFSMR